MQVSGVTGYLLGTDWDYIQYKGHNIELTYDALTLYGTMQQEKTLKFLTKAEICTAPFKFLKFEGQYALENAKNHIDSHDRKSTVTREELIEKIIDRHLRTIRQEGGVDSYLWEVFAYGNSYFGYHYMTNNELLSHWNGDCEDDADIVNSIEETKA